MFIVDRLAQISPWVRDFCTRAEIFQVPFAIFPFDDTDGRPGLLWTDTRIAPGLLPRHPGARQVVNAELARAPYQHTILVSEEAEPGALFISALPWNPETYDIINALSLLPGSFEELDRLYKQPTELWKLALVGWFDRDERGPLTSQCYTTLRTDQHVGSFPIEWPFYYLTKLSNPAQCADVRLPADLSEDTILTQAIELSAFLITRSRLMTAQINGQLPPSFESTFADAHRWLGQLGEDSRRMCIELEKDHWNVSVSAVTAFSLLNCRNIVREPIDPPYPRAARRRGDPPPYRYHVLKVQPFAVKARGARASTPGAPIALHWVRGHFKHYTDERPLLGKFVGTYWWQPHLAGRAPGYVDKDYAIDIAGDEAIRLL